MVELGAAVTPGGNGIVIYRGFKAIATLSRADAEHLSEAIRWPYARRSIRGGWPARSAGRRPRLWQLALFVTRATRMSPVVRRRSSVTAGAVSAAQCRR